ncbi:MAG: DNA translocase FtsK [Chloroflexi bacterium]|nr:DNA translocase FtsK [Chloroflexota bacterium]
MAPEKEPVAPVPAEPAASPPVSAGTLAGSIMLEAAADAGGWRLPSLDILDHAPASVPSQTDNEARARLLEQSLSSYGIDASVVEINPGPAVTQFGVEPGWVRRFKDVRVRDADGKQVLDERGKPVVRREEVSRTRVKVDAIANLDKDLAMAMAAPSIRIEAPVPGKSMVGIEVPNTTSEVVSLRSILESPAFAKLRAKSKLAMALGKGSGGDPVVADLANMPHLLIAGATGSGKSVCINAVLVCILMQATPQEVRLLLIDPKRVEMAAFNSIPHLAAPVIVDVEKVVGALKWAIQEMEERYKRFAKVGARNLESYNSNQRVVEPLPYLVIAVDELADLMMAAPYDIEHSLTRLAQLGRATGIHLVVATQRPSVDVVTGLIKANFPTRISFAVASLVDSRTILDSAGAEKLLGRGDMLYLPQDAPKPTRIQGVFVSDREIERVVRAWNSQTSVRPPARMTLEEQSPSKPAGRPVESAAIVPPPAEEPAAVPEALALTEDLPTALEPGENDDPLLVQAREMAQQNTRLSPSLLSRRLKIGYTKAKRLMEELEAEGQIDQEQELAR